MQFSMHSSASSILKTTECSLLSWSISLQATSKSTVWSSSWMLATKTTSSTMFMGILNHELCEYHRSVHLRRVSSLCPVQLAITCLWDWCRKNINIRYYRYCSSSKCLTVLLHKLEYLWVHLPNRFNFGVQYFLSKDVTSDHNNMDLDVKSSYSNVIVLIRALMSLSSFLHFHWVWCYTTISSSWNRVVVISIACVDLLYCGCPSLSNS